MALSGLTVVNLMRARELLDSVEVPEQGRRMRATGRQIQHFRLDAGLPQLAGIDDGAAYEVELDSWAVHPLVFD